MALKDFGFDFILCSLLLFVFWDLLLLSIYVDGKMNLELIADSF